MTLPVLGPMTLTGFEHAWYFLFLFVVAGLVGLYIAMQAARRKRLLRFANTELLESVSPRRPSRWRHLATILLMLSLVMLTIAMAAFPATVPWSCWSSACRSRCAPPTWHPAGWLPPRKPPNSSSTR